MNLRCLIYELQIVLMRSCVQQARVHVVHKLTKEIKLLKQRKGVEAAVQKSLRKSERYLEEIKEIKVLHN